jgi:hypothetical protein
MIAAVTVVFAVAHLDSRRESGRAFNDFSREQAMLARSSLSPSLRAVPGATHNALLHDLPHAQRRRGIRPFAICKKQLGPSRRVSMN